MLIFFTTNEKGEASHFLFLYTYYRNIRLREIEFSRHEFEWSFSGKESTYQPATSGRIRMVAMEDNILVNMKVREISQAKIQCSRVKIPRWERGGWEGNVCLPSGASQVQA